MKATFRHALPRRKTCRRCDGKKWFDSAIGLIACPACDASGKGEIDVEWLIEDWKRIGQSLHETQLKIITFEEESKGKEYDHRTSRRNH
jgi:hypothetical protein